MKKKASMQLFQYGPDMLRVVLDDNKDPWWVAKDVCAVLGLSHVQQAVGRLEDDEKLTCKIYSAGQNRDMWLISESGLYALILTSNKPEARPFRRWVTHEVLPEIRRTGTYSRELIYRYVLPECRDWSRVFPPEFFQEIYRLMGWNWSTHLRTKTHPSYMGKIFLKWVYPFLPDGVFERVKELNIRLETGFLEKKHHQYLSEVGLKHLDSHVLLLVTLMRAAYNWAHFEELAKNALVRSLETRQMRLLVAV